VVQIAGVNMSDLQKRTELNACMCDTLGIRLFYRCLVLPIAFRGAGDPYLEGYVISAGKGQHERAVGAARLTGRRS
jgi:hypothetical protein